VNIDEKLKPKPEIETLLAAEEGARNYSDSGAVQHCPPAEKPERKPKPPIKVLLWHIRELGGGFQSPMVRPDYCLQAYAAIIKAVKADAIILLGLSRTAGWTPEYDGTAVRMREEMQDCGIAEVKRLLSELQKCDGSGGWQFVPVNGPDGKPAYHGHETACFFYKTSSGITCGPVRIASCGPAFLAIAPLRIPESFAAPPDLPLLAPLRVGRHSFSRELMPDPPTQGDLPPNALVGFSASGGHSGSDYLDFRTSCDVEYARPLQEGTVLKIPFWERIAAEEECIIENHMALNPGDVLLQDRVMCWESLRPDLHPKDLESVCGQLADSLLIRHTGAGLAPRLEKLRIIDLVRSALDSDVRAKVAGDASLDEDGAISSQRKAFVETLAEFKSEDAMPDTAIERQIAEAMLFARKLSDHWPILADVCQAL
jgi:hypothetical protein